MKKILYLLICFIFISCNKSKVVDRHLDVLIGLPKTEVIQTLGNPESIKETKKYYITDGYQNYIYEDYMLVYKKDSYSDDRIIYSEKFPEGLKLFNDKYTKVEFYLENDRVKSWIGIKE